MGRKDNRRSGSLSVELQYPSRVHATSRAEAFAQSYTDQIAVLLEHVQRQTEKIEVLILQNKRLEEQLLAVEYHMHVPGTTTTQDPSSGVASSSSAVSLMQQGKLDEQIAQFHELVDNGVVVDPTPPSALTTFIRLRPSK
ncbi:hypothetical protein PC129_g21162 [Phytophthora cactorum]|uniref:Uncharacterized protein n=1 Tax=Phytophthora cactorum TaxID=29920 RepID=A0A329RGA8_9STRA|nr:hypothetical protein Pcac1_g15851 [Phytophthora cactorum]KAG2797066.1 hypothetical protein PC111_g21444 [Phytophthora cactorum]KAG2876095.1 hypothetical protein PC114_g24371 [Phytophthora cactorum]KAG2883164.1 hypothetical protein PC115_g21714 [Phytophthora cactorum]KAG2891914.1 hypothetical protein PC117_g24144 [Phytophthora cactorum]